MGLNVSEIIPIATLTTGGYPGQIYVPPGATCECGNRADTLLVVTTNSKGEAEEKQFSSPSDPRPGGAPPGLGRGGDRAVRTTADQ